jgi:hypothetical protein
MKLKAFVAFCALCGLGICAPMYAQTNPSVGGAVQAPAPKGATMTGHASGALDVKVVPAAPDDKAEGSALGRWSIDKQYHGDLDATAKGEMLTAGTDVKGSAGYVAIERVTGMLNGRKGSFVLQHSGTMSHGALQLDIHVVPDSGTGQLAGLAGKLTITIAPDGKHSYTFDYTLPEKP